MKIIYSRWDEGARRWRNQPAKELGQMALICAKESHTECLHAVDERGAGQYVFTDTVALDKLQIQSVLFTKETVIVKLVPRKKAA